MTLIDTNIQGLYVQHSFSMEINITLTYIHYADLTEI